MKRRILPAVAICVFLFNLLALPMAAQPDGVEARLERIENKLDELLELHRRHWGGDVAITEVAWEQVQPCEEPNVRLDKQIFVICHHPEWKFPLWVGYHLNQQLLQGDEDRTDDFREDDQLPEDQRSTLNDYRGSGYDRGHNAPAAAFKRSREAMSTTFLLSNMTPQTPQLNRQIWRLLEDGVRQLASGGGDIWVFTGAVIVDENNQPSDPTEFIGDNRVAVPTHSYKAILHRDPAGNWQAFAFMIPNLKQRIPGVYSDYLVTVDQVEAASGVDFFPQLPDAIENRLEGEKGQWPVEVALLWLLQIGGHTARAAP